MIRKRVLVLICAAVLCGILIAGLVPFQRPRNGVTWLGNENGLRFGINGTVLSSGTFQVAAGQDDASCSLEIWLEPGLVNGSNTLLSFSTPENPLQLSLRRYRASLELKREISGAQHRSEMIGIENVFHQNKPVFITITSGAKKTSVYIDGALAQSFPRFRFGKDCAGELVIGTSPIGNDSSPGKILGLAIYQRELEPAEVFEHYGSWTSKGRPNLSGNEQATAVYPFNERAGNIVHNALSSGVDLFVPKRFSLLHQPFLEPFWKEFQPTASYWGDILINIIGFIPLGFFFFAYWSTTRPIKHAALTTVVLGFATSLTIEVLQSYLPTRFSGTTDLITNTFGTFVGVRLYASKAGQALLAKVY